MMLGDNLELVFPEFWGGKCMRETIKKLWHIYNVGTSLGTNSSMFANCSVFVDVREVRSSVYGQNQMFGHVRSSVLKILKKIGLIFYY